jgi:hypothetical protein
MESGTHHLRRLLSSGCHRLRQLALNLVHLRIRVWVGGGGGGGVCGGGGGGEKGGMGMLVAAGQQAARLPGLAEPGWASGSQPRVVEH